MPRPKTDNDQQIALRVPKRLLARATALIPHVAPRGVMITRTDVIRIALLLGIEALEAERKS